MSLCAGSHWTTAEVVVVLTTWRSVGPEMTGKHGEEHVPVPRRQSGTTQRGSGRFSRGKFVHQLCCLVCFYLGCSTHGS